jgi:serine/threonine-protein kinase HipA
VHQLDLCQLAGKPSTIKYEADRGPSLKQCHQLLKQHGISGNDMKRFLQWIFFNLFVGNNDSHAKNISVYFPPDQHISLTPFYDLLCTTIYPGLSKRFAFSIGGESRPSHLNRNNLTQMAIELGYKPAFVMQIAKTTADAILKNSSLVASECQILASVGSENTMLERLQSHVCSNTQKLQKRLLI